MNISMCTLTVCALAVTALASGPLVIMDGELSDDDWTSISYATGGGGMSTGEQAETGGNPDQHRIITNTLNGPSLVVGGHFRTDATWDLAARGTFATVDFSIDKRYISPATGGDGQAFGVAIIQNGRVFRGSYDITGGGTTWTQTSRIGRTPENFTPWDNGDPIDLSPSGGVIHFGFYTANSTGGGGGSIIAAFDNFAITVTPAACPGDANNDGSVDFADLNLLLDNWNAAVAPGTSGDVNNDGTVNFDDLNLLLDEWGSVC